MAYVHSIVKENIKLNLKESKINTNKKKINNRHIESNWD